MRVNAESSRLRRLARKGGLLALAHRHSFSHLIYDRVVTVAKGVKGVSHLVAITVVGLSHRIGAFWTNDRANRVEKDTA
jgi:hypothetical protein